MRFLMYVADLSAVQSYTFSLEKCPNIQLKICKKSQMVRFTDILRR